MLDSTTCFTLFDFLNVWITLATLGTFDMAMANNRECSGGRIAETLRVRVTFDWFRRRCMDEMLSVGHVPFQGLRTRVFCSVADPHRSRGVTLSPGRDAWRRRGWSMR